jgi:hypothetical protein
MVHAARHRFSTDRGMGRENQDTLREQQDQDDHEDDHDDG